MITASPEDRLLHAALLMRDNRVGSVVVVEGERPVGMLTDRDIMLRMIDHKTNWPEMKIREAMTPKPVTVTEGAGLWELIRLMKQHAIRRFPVVSGDGKLIGILTLDDLIELLGKELSGVGEAIAFEVGHEKLVTG